MALSTPGSLSPAPVAEAVAEPVAPDASRALALRRFLSSPASVLGVVIVGLLVLSAVLAPLLAPGSPTEQDLAAKLRPPSAEHLLGTDLFGRDILSRIIYGGRISLLVGVVAVAIGGTIGVVLGLVSGYYGGWVDHILMRCMDALNAFPAILLAIAIIGAVGAGLLNLELAVAVTSVPLFARITRASVLEVRGLDYIAVARSLGTRSIRIILRHVLPNSVGPVIVVATLQIASAILAASALSFLGLGVQPPTPEWGSMLADGRGYLTTAPWVSLFPGLAIMLAVMGFNLVGDALRDVLDPTLVDVR
jgi:peptide/nickel transport system permease protein